MTLQVQRNQRKPKIFTGRAYRKLAIHYEVRRRLMPQVWRGPLVDALVRRAPGTPLRVAVARMYRQLRRLETT